MADARQVKTNVNIEAAATLLADRRVPHSTLWRRLNPMSNYDHAVRSTRVLNARRVGESVEAGNGISTTHLSLCANNSTITAHPCRHATAPLNSHRPYSRCSQSEKFHSAINPRLRVKPPFS